MMTATATDGKLIDACAFLLGPQVRARGPAYLQGLDVAVVRRAYRVIAVTSHPDAMRRAGSRQTDGARFIEASRAYELLMGYLLNRRPGTPPPSTRAQRGRAAQPGARPAGEKRSTGERHGAGEKRAGAERHSAGERKGAGDRRGSGKASDRHGAGDKRSTSDRHASGEHRSTGERTHGSERRSTRAGSSAPLFYRGPLPRRKLRLAEYLYYTGRVSWQSLISAIVWQKKSQPRFGELAKEMKAISSQDVMRILGSRLQHEQTGATAQRLRLLTAAQVERILRLQRARRRPIGRYFVEEESLSSTTINAIMRELYRHNARYGRQ